ncbi:MAG TPA: DUF4142 domain-containing protein, partial [Verrucomicrobiae bacterium]|nr:DUF4142 domain-containing protein [Verrucomicrobiae bacterium]
SQLTPDEIRFLQRSAEYNQTDIQLGQTMVQKCDAPSLKTYGQRLADDHTLANQQLQSIIAQTGATVPTAPNPDQQQMLDRLNGLSGTDIDRAAIDDSMRSQERQINLDMQAANNSQNPEVKAYAQQNLTINQDELNQCRGLNVPAPTAAPVYSTPPATTVAPVIVPPPPPAVEPVPPPPSERPAGPGISPQQPQ